MAIHNIFVADCVNADKTNLGLIIDVIGWNINLVNRTVGVAKHNLLKSLHGFMTVRLGDNLSIRHFMKLASWASRYSIICRYMKPFTAYLYSISNQMKNLDATKPVTSPIYQIVRLWVMFLTPTWSHNPSHGVYCHLNHKHVRYCVTLTHPWRE